MVEPSLSGVVHHDMYTTVPMVKTYRRKVVLKEEGSRFAVVLTTVAVILTLGAIWFAVFR